MTIKVTNWHKGRDHHQDGHHYVHGQQGLFKVAASLPSLSKWYIQFPFALNFFLKVFFKIRPVHFQSNNQFAFKFASLVHSYSYLVKSSLSKIIFSNHFSRPRLHLDTFHFHFDFLFSFSWLSLSPFSWSFLSHFIFPNQGHISKILHIPKFPKSFHFPFYLKFSFTLHLPRPGSHQ